jgi:hypothetical protein
LTLSFGKTRFNIQKKYLAFFTIVPLMAATAFVQVPCPVCGGTGGISSTGMTGVVISDLQYTELSDTEMAGCDSYRIYQYAISLVAQNGGEQDAGGYVQLFLINTETGQLLDKEFTVVEVASGMSVKSDFNMTFRVDTLLDKPNITEIQAQILTSDVPCKACDGKGRVALNSWPFLNSMKQSFITSERVATPYVPPLHVDTEANPGDF